MIQKAREKARADVQENTQEKPGQPCENLRFITADMTALHSRFQQGEFNGIICFGNTLVHLSGPDQIKKFLSDSISLLLPGGVLLLQIINYDRIVNRYREGLSIDLSPIENEAIRFERRYYYDSERGRIRFETVLTDKRNGEKTHNEMMLYPLQKRELEGYLQEAGYTNSRFFGNFAKRPLTNESVPLIATAAK